MMAVNQQPGSYTVTYRSDHGSGRFVSHSAADAERVRAAWQATGFAVHVEPIAQPAIQQVLAEQEVAA